VAGLTVVGTVERIAPQATIKNNIKGFAVRIFLKDADKQIRPGMTANIKIPVASADNVVAVPLASVFTERDPDTYETEHYVYVKKGEEQFERRPVTIGVSDFFFAEIQSGLSAGEVVALEPPKEEADRAATLAKTQTEGGGPRRASKPKSSHKPSAAGAKPNGTKPADNGSEPKTNRSTGTQKVNTESRRT